MPIWPVWQLTGWVVDPHYLVRLQTFRQRAAEVSLIWRDDTSSVREVVPRLYEGGRKSFNMPAQALAAGALGREAQQTRRHSDQLHSCIPHRVRLFITCRNDGKR